MFSQACVKNSTHGGRCTPPPPGQTPPQGRYPWADTILVRHPPRQIPTWQTPPMRRPLQRTVRILPECIFVFSFIRTGTHEEQHNGFMANRFVACRSSCSIYFHPCIENEKQCSLHLEPFRESGTKLYL